MERKYFLTRHSIKPKGEDVESDRYKGISKRGVELARSSAKNILDDIERSPAGAVIFLGGVSDEVRTRSTAEVYGDELKKMLADRKDYIVITRDDIPRGRGYSAIAKQVKEVIDANPDKRIIVDIPLFLKEFSPKERKDKSRWFTKQGKLTSYAEKLLGRNKNDEYASLKDWIEHDGEDIDGLKGPKPEEVAKQYERGIQRLEKFAKKYVGDRPYVTGIVGHSWEEDTYLTYLAGEGKIDLPTLERVSSGKGMIKETEMASVHVTPEITTLTYRGKEYQRKNLEKRVSSIIAISGLLGSIFFSSFSLTGNAIGNLTTNSTSLIGAGLFVVGLVGAFFWMKGKK